MGAGLSSSGVAELALLQELHAYSSVPSGHSTLLVPLAVVLGTSGAAGNVDGVDEQGLTWSVASRQGNSSRVEDWQETYAG